MLFSEENSSDAVHKRRIRRNLPQKQYIFSADNFTIQMLKIDNMTIIVWDEAFLDTDRVLKWCSRPKVAVPVSLATGGVNITQNPFVLISWPSKQMEPHLKAVALDYPSKEALCQIPDQFFEQNNC